VIASAVSLHPLRHLGQGSRRVPGAVERGATPASSQSVALAADLVRMGAPDRSAWSGATPMPPDYLAASQVGALGLGASEPSIDVGHAQVQPRSLQRVAIWNVGRRGLHWSVQLNVKHRGDGLPRGIFFPPAPVTP
jgi:hypothetical protein